MTLCKLQDSSVVHEIRFACSHHLLHFFHRGHVYLDLFSDADPLVNVHHDVCQVSPCAACLSAFLSDMPPSLRANISDPRYLPCVDVSTLLVSVSRFMSALILIVIMETLIMCAPVHALCLSKTSVRRHADAVLMNCCGDVPAICSTVRF